jgi:cell division septum initiation protein DivIVA
MSENQGVAGLGPLPAHDPANKTEELREEIEPTRAGLSEMVDASQERLGPEHVVEQAQQTVQETTKNRVGRASRARERMQQAAAGKVQPMVSSASNTAKQVAGSASNTAKQVAGSASDVAKDAAKKVLLPAIAIPFAGGLVIGLISGLLLGLLISNTVRSGAVARAQSAAAPEPQDVAPRPWWMVWKRR